MVEWDVKTAQFRTAVESVEPPAHFQAEYEGSIPFTRSNVFRYLGEAGLSFRQSRLSHSDNVFAVCSQRLLMRLSCATCLPSSSPCKYLPIALGDDHSPFFI